MVDDLKVSLELGVFISEAVHAVGTGGQYLSYAILLEGLDILLGHRLEQVFIAGSTCGIARASLFLAKDGIVHSGLIQ